MIPVIFFKTFLVSTLLLVYSVSSIASEEGSPLSAKCSTAKARMRRALALDEPHVRKRRQIDVPKGTAWECKWAINIPLETQRRYAAKLQLAIPINVRIPQFLYDESGLEKLFGLYEEEGGGGEGEERIGYVDYESKFEESALGSISASPSPQILQNRHFMSPKEEYVNKNLSYRASEKRRRITRSVFYSRAVQNERMELYYRVEGLLNKMGLLGPTCLQRTICEVSNQPIEEGVVGDFINLFFTPSLTTLSQEIEDYGKLEDYVKAERHGEGGGLCSDLYNECPVSMFELLPVVANSLFNQ